MMSDECRMMNGCWVLGSRFWYLLLPAPRTQHPTPLSIHHSAFIIHHFIQFSSRSQLLLQLPAKALRRADFGLAVSDRGGDLLGEQRRSEEHTSELQSHSFISYA